MDSKLAKTHTKVVIYGGNGFVGTRVAQALSQLNTCTVCLSRTGHKPLHLKDDKWSERVRWCKGDASDADQQLLASADVLICLVGSAPLPTLSKQAYAQQLFMNGTTCVNAIESAAQAGIKRVVLLGAKIPLPLRTDFFAYSKGKNLALEAARKFAQLSDQHSAIVLQPGAIYGKRHLSNGRVVPLDWFMGPLAKIMPWQFISVDAVAKKIAHAATELAPYEGTFTLISNSQIRSS